MAKNITDAIVLVNICRLYYTELKIFNRKDRVFLE